MCVPTFDGWWHIFLILIYFEFPFFLFFIWFFDFGVWRWQVQCLNRRWRRWNGSKRWRQRAIRHLLRPAASGASWPTCWANWDEWQCPILRPVSATTTTITGRCVAIGSVSMAASRPFRGYPARRPSIQPRPSKVIHFTSKWQSFFSFPLSLSPHSFALRLYFSNFSDKFFFPFPKQKERWSGNKHNIHCAWASFLLKIVSLSINHACHYVSFFVFQLRVAIETGLFNYCKSKVRVRSSEWFTWCNLFYWFAVELSIDWKWASASLRQFLGDGCWRVGYLPNRTKTFLLFIVSFFN